MLPNAVPSFPGDRFLGHLGAIFRFILASVYVVMVHVGTLFIVVVVVVGIGVCVCDSTVDLHAVGALSSGPRRVVHGRGCEESADMDHDHIHRGQD